MRPVGIIRSPFKETVGVPIQPTAGKGIEGSIEIFDEFVPGLEGLDEFSHIILLFHLHRYSDFSLKVVPFLDDKATGVFSTRAPRRPNPIGLSVVRLLSIYGGFLRIMDIDMVDGTPLLDIKPFIPFNGNTSDMRFGWLEGRMEGFRSTSSDQRFDMGKEQEDCKEKH